MDPTITGADVPGSEPFPPALAHSIDRIAQDMISRRRPRVRRTRQTGERPGVDRNIRPDLQALLDRLEAEYGRQ